MATKTPKPEAPEAEGTEAPATVLEAEYWAKNGRFRIGDLAQFTPFVPGFNNMGKLEDSPRKIVIARDEDEHKLFRGQLVTRDPALIADLDARILRGTPIRLHEKRQVPL